MNVLIFSKDRACQLDLLLRSWQRFVLSDAPACLFAASGPEYEAGYRIAQARFPWVRWTGESDFRAQTIAALDPARAETMFLVDDQVFRRPVNLPALACLLPRRPDVLGLSLRLSPAVDWCFSLDRPSPPPALRPAHVLDLPCLTWKWRGCPGDWGYPMSLDGTALRTAEVLGLLAGLRFANPNTLEAAMARRPFCRPEMACLQEQAVLNVPANLVQSVYRNRTCAGPTAAELNAAYLAGQEIDLDPLVAMPARSCHVAAEYVLRPSSVVSRQLQRTADHGPLTTDH